MLIAIDHGNKQVKTVHGNAIVSGVQKSKTRPYGRDILKYGGSYYTLSAQRIPYQKDKTTDERFFILSLFAIAEEIEAQGAYTSGLMPIDLAIGLPPAHFGAQNKAFVRYFKRKEPIYFSYRDKLYSILIRNVQCYPQAFAAAAMMLGELATVPRALILDVGGGACLLRRQIETSGKVAHPVFVEDVNANAKGFEYLYRCTVTGA